MIDYDQILLLLKECDTFLKDLDYLYDVERCKIANLTGSVLWKSSKSIDPEKIERVLAAITVFKVYKLSRLELQSMYTYAQLLLR